MIIYQLRAGFVMLLTVLVVGAIAAASAAALLLLGLSIERNSYAIQLSAQAMAGAWSCAEFALAQLQENIDYSGNRPHFITLEDSTEQECHIYPLNGDGNFDRILCTESTAGDFTQRRLHIRISRVWPTTTIESWKEVSQMPPECGVYTGEVLNCGNGVATDPNEECDDNNTLNNDGCSSACQIEFCGDSIIQAGEQCDDGGFCSGAPNPYCTSDADCIDMGTCEPIDADGSHCIDGTATPGTDCTEDSDCPGGYCSQPCDVSCLIEYCGDGGTPQLGEQCDEGTGVCNDGLNDGEYCVLSTDCFGGSCEGNHNDADATCTSFCTDAPHCGDSFIQTGEDCDNGGTCGVGGLTCADNRDCNGVDCIGIDGDGCNASCVKESTNSEPNEEQLILYWNLNESTGNKADNVVETSSDLDGSLRNMENSDWENSPKPLGKAWFGNHLHFNGSDEYVRSTSNGSILVDLLPEEFSVSFWVQNDGNIDDDSFYESGILCKSDDNQARGWGFYFKPVEFPDECDCEWWEWWCDEPDDERLCNWADQKRINFFVGEWDDNVASAPISTETNWHHIVGTYDGENIKIYVDGTEAAPGDQDTNDYSNVEPYADDYRMQAARCGDDWYLDGRLDDIRFYTYPLTLPEVQYLADPDNYT